MPPTLRRLHIEHRKALEAGEVADQELAKMMAYTPERCDLAVENQRQCFHDYPLEDTCLDPSQQNHTATESAEVVGMMRRLGSAVRPVGVL
jgi:hypothetical protein